MFIGRTQELQLLDTLHASANFEFLVLYGRRRVGKTSLLQQFTRSHSAIFFSAQEKNDSLNLSDFSKTIQYYFDHQSFGAFASWESAFEYINLRCMNQRLTLIIDEFPFIASENPSIKSILQHAIDHHWKNKNILLILCGSSVSFMENEVMGYKSPLYGRATSQLELLPFDYFDSAAFFPSYSNLEKMMAYAILGGIPCYLQNFSDRLSLAKNIETQIFRTGSFLKEEPQVLLKMELREPAVYNSIFEAIATGSTRLNDISQKIHEESFKCAKYINTLRAIKLLDKMVPCGDDPTSKKSIYHIIDNYFLFWYHFIFSNKSYYDILGPADAAAEIMQPENFSNYMGLVFEQICTQYMYRQAKLRHLPFIPHKIGKWWGANPSTKKSDDIDILLLDKKQENAIFCECKFRNTPFDKQEFDNLISASHIFTTPVQRYYYLFSKSGFTKWVEDMANSRNDIRLLSVDDLFMD